MFKAVICLASILIPVIHAQQAAAPSPPPSSPPPSSEPIPLTQIALRGEELTRTLREVTRALPTPSELAEFDENLREQENYVRASTRNHWTYWTATLRPPRSGNKRAN